MGKFGRELLGIGQLLFLIFIMASHILTFSVAMNTITEHGTCTIAFGVVGLIISFIGALPRTMGKVYWMSIACEFMGLTSHFFLSNSVLSAFSSIFAATVATMISVGVENAGSAHVEVTTSVSFYQGFLAVTNIIFAYGMNLFQIRILALKIADQHRVIPPIQSAMLLFSDSYLKCPTLEISPSPCPFFIPLVPPFTLPRRSSSIAMVGHISNRPLWDLPVLL